MILTTIQSYVRTVDALITVAYDCAMNPTLENREALINARGEAMLARDILLHLQPDASYKEAV